MNFKAGERVATFKMDITNDLVAEDPEEFYLDLEIPPAATAIDVIKGSPDSATVRIADEDCECCSSALYCSEYHQDIVHLI